MYSYEILWFVNIKLAFLSNSIIKIFIIIIELKLKYLWKKENKREIKIFIKNLFNLRFYMLYYINIKYIYYKLNNEII